MTANIVFGGCIQWLSELGPTIEIGVRALIKGTEGACTIKHIIEYNDL